MMDKKEFLENILKIHSVSVSTLSLNGLPNSRIIDMMYIENNEIYFLTARGKNFYKELMNNNYVAISCQRYNKSCVLKGYVERISNEEQSKYLDIIFKNNRYMWGTYPKDTRKILDVFKISKWYGEYFDVTTKPITRISFSHNFDNFPIHEYKVNQNKCISCQKCIAVCPQKCIDFSTNKACIKSNNCLKCGACKEACPVNAVEYIEK